MRVVTGTQMAEIDRKAKQDLQIDGLILMENAGLAVVDLVLEVVETWDEQDQGAFKNVLIVAGKGNNGGDGFVIARHLINSGIPTAVFAIAERSEYKDEALKNYLALENFGDINIITDDTLEDLRDSLLESSIVVDALLGTGLKGDISDNYSAVIDIINESDGIVIAVDVPSGVQADTGKVESTCVEADYTLTFGLPKLGLLLYPGADYVGELQVGDIGIPDFLTDNHESKIHITDEDYITGLLPWRPIESHKGTFGKVLTVAGSGFMSGAALLSAYSSLKIGAGCSVLASPESVIPHFIGKYPELIYSGLAETSKKAIAARAIEQIVPCIDDAEAVVYGPGISVCDDTIELTKNLLEHLVDNSVNAVIDADGLNCLARLGDVRLSENIVINPHPAELARLLSVDVEEILDDKLKYLQMACDKYGCVVLLKGSNTLIGYSDFVFINPTGNSGLATAGSGDVLSGIIAGLMAQSLDPFAAAVVGAYLHGLSADVAMKYSTEYTLVASDIIENLANALKVLGMD